MLESISWLRVYIPLERLDAGLTILLIVWIATVIAGFVIWFRHEKAEKAGS